MSMSSLLSPPGPATAPVDLHEQYRSYRTRQAAALARMLPREAVRPLYRRALREGELGRAQDDPLGVLVECCERLLPLPPFEVWLRDVTLHPDAHLEDLDDSVEAPDAAAPATLEARTFDVDGDPWVAHLRSYRDGEAWRGFIAFEERRSGRVLRTTLVFRESSAADVRTRFLDFDHGALEAFWRSAS